MKNLTFRMLSAALAIMATFASARGQNELIVSQYIHNYFAVNPAFAGSRDALSLFGGVRRQWSAIDDTPASAILTANTPLRKEKLATGMSLYYQTLHQTTNAGLLATIGYRTKVTRNAWLGLALQPGVAFRSLNWGKIRTIDEQDEVFAENESGVAPLLGFGASFYGDNFFAGISTTSFIVTNDFERKDTKFAPGDATYVACGGYWFALGNDFAIQPSAMASFNKTDKGEMTISASGIWRDMFWLTAAYRTTKEATAGLAYSLNRRFKVAYSYTMDLGPLKSYSGGSHELTLQYDFIYKVKAVGPRFY
ncbi:MAG: PorP/SprF family type IX secretion system membrane protein [Bacteroidales bacterium]|nr:PorP/SprF family type IX secretion system membrane protein [Bacteroidales bacterium]